MNQKLFLKYIRNYLMVLGVFCLLMVPIYIAVYRGSQETILSSGYNQLNKSVIDLDNRINKMRIITDLVRSNESVKKLAKVQVTPAAKDYTLLLKAKQYMASCLTIGMEDGREFILFRNNDIVITNDEILSSSMYHDYSGYGQMDMTYADFLECIFDNKKMIQYLPLIDGEEWTGITCIMKGPNNLGVGMAYDMALIFELPLESLQQTIGIEVDPERDFCYIVDLDGQIIYQTNYQGEAFDEETLEKESVRYRGNPYKLLRVQAENSGLQWIVGISSRTMGQGSARVNMVLWLYLLGAVICMIVFSVYWAVQQAIKMRSILQMFKNNDDMEMTKNEYRYIASGISGLYDENERYREKIDHLQKSIGSSMMERLLTRGVYTLKEKEEIQDYLSWDMEFYCVVCAYIRHKDENELLNCFYRMDDFFEQYFSCIMANIGKNERTYIIRMNMQDEPDTRKLSRMLNEFAADSDEVLIGISSIGTGLENVQLCYQQAKLMARQIADSYEGKVREFQGRLENRDKIFKLNLDQRIYDLILAEEKETLKALFEKIRSYAAKSIFRTEAEIMQFFFEIQNPIAKVWDEIEKDGMQVQEISSYRADRTIMELLEELEQSALGLCDCIQKGKENSKNAFHGKILQFVEDNYADKDMCVSFVARHFGISDKRLVVLFKELTGKNFSAYVEARRMHQVEKYLLETDWSMAKIADAVGYNTIDAFYKSFKKIYGLAPGKWKENRLSQMEVK